MKIRVGLLPFSGYRLVWLLSLTCYVIWLGVVVLGCKVAGQVLILQTAMVKLSCVQRNAVLELADILRERTKASTSFTHAREHIKRAVHGESALCATHNRSYLTVDP